MTEFAEKCAVCQSKHLREIDGFGKLSRVTSDSRIWSSGGRLGQCRSCGFVQKIFDPALAKEIDAVYSGYDLYFQGAGKEQKIFVDGIGRQRSKLLLENFFSTIPDIDSRDRPTWMDFGCGKGNLLRAMSETHPDWKLFGADLSEKNRELIEGVKGVEGYISGGIDAIDGAYDVLSLSHVLEHISQPLSFLRDLSLHLKPDGYLLIAVPNWLQNPFDLLVVDHCLHFTVPQLMSVVQAVGFEVVHIDEHCLPKELVLVARLSRADRVLDQKPCELSIEQEWETLAGMADWLTSLVHWGETRAKSSTSGLLGTALAATWLDQSCGSSFAFFVDEDPDRSGTSYLGRDVVLPDGVPPGAEVLVPLPCEVAERVCKRLNHDSGPTYLAPPPISRH